MPTYDYQCKACGHTFDLFQSMSDAVKRKCPKCGKNALERLIGTGAAVIFKGSGFYQTDYRTESYKKSAEADKKPAEAKATDSKPADTKSADPKPAAKPDSASKGSDTDKPPKPAAPEPPKPALNPGKGKPKPNPKR